MEHHESLWTDPHFWVLASFVIFVGLAWKPLSRMIAKGLDERAAKIKAELEEAGRLREEAQAVLLAYQKKQQESLKEAEAIVAKAKDDAARMAAAAEAELKAAIENRTKAAMDKIAQAETQALQEVQSHVVDVAISAARSIIVSHLDKNASDDLIKLAITDIERKVH